MGPRALYLSGMVALGILVSCQSQRTVSPRFNPGALPAREVTALYGQSHTSTYPDPRDYVETERHAGVAAPVRLPLPSGAPALAGPSPTAGERTPTHHTVSRGDTLYAIGLRYGTTVESLKAANGLTSDTIFPGDVLAIPRN